VYLYIHVHVYIRAHAHARTHIYVYIEYVIYIYQRVYYGESAHPCRNTGIEMMLTCTGESVPLAVVKQLQDKGVEMVDMTGFQSISGMSWRFMVASDGGVERYCVRDIDAVLTQREKSAVDEWVVSGKEFHVMRDHPFHSRHSMLGGLWCATHDALPHMVDLLNKHPPGWDYMEDMHWLHRVVWPIAQNSVMQHDSFSCERYPGSLPFPTERVNWEFVGVSKGFMEQNASNLAVKTLMEAPVPDACRSPTSDTTRNHQPLHDDLSAQSLNKHSHRDALGHAGASRGRGERAITDWRRDKGLIDYLAR